MGRLVNIFPGETEALGCVNRYGLNLVSSRLDAKGNHPSLGYRQLVGPDSGESRGLGLVQGVDVPGFKGVSNVTLKNINAKGWDIGLKIEQGGKWLVEDCDFSDNFHYPEAGWGELGQHGGIVLENVDHSTLRKNKANRVSDACHLAESNDNLVEDNEVCYNGLPSGMHNAPWTFKYVPNGPQNGLVAVEPEVRADDRSLERMRVPGGVRQQRR